MRRRGWFGYDTRMKRHSWPKVFAFLGLALVGLVLADFSTTVATGGIAAGNLGRGEGGRELIAAGSAVLLIGVAMFAIFGYLALAASVVLVKSRR